MNFFDKLKQTQEAQTTDLFTQYIRHLDTLDDQTEDKQLERLMSKLGITPEDAYTDHQTVKRCRKLAGIAEHLPTRQVEWEDAKADLVKAKGVYAAETERLRQEVADADRFQRSAKKQLMQADNAMRELRELDRKMIEALGVEIR